MSNEPNQILTSGAANSLGISKRLLNLMIRNGKVPPPESKTDSGYYLWTLKDIDAARAALDENKRAQRG